jgi:predicted metal-binding membrane protein
MIGLLRWPRALSAVALAALCVSAWLYLLGGAGAGMTAWQMTSLTPFPHRAVAMSMAGMDMPLARWDLAGASLVVAMWWTMMIAMMLPAAAPALLLYDRARQQRQRDSAAGGQIASTGLFAAGYLVVWLGFSLLATALQWALVRGGLLSAEMLYSQSRVLSAVLLLASGAYQLSPLKRACLTQCRSPAAFIARQWRSGVAGALRLGVLHGAWCVGCCGLLMVLLFVGGVMNVVWIAVLAVLVLVEKLLPGGPWVGRGIGALLIAWGLATLVA